MKKTPWKAHIVGKDLVNGILTITVHLKKGNESFEEKFQTSQLQDENWLDESIKRKVRHLESHDNLTDTITIGEVDLSEEDLSKKALTEKDRYKAKLLQFEKFVLVLAKGFTTQENEDFKILKKYLTDNFKAEYLDIFQ